MKDAVFRRCSMFPHLLMKRCTNTIITHKSTPSSVGLSLDDVVVLFLWAAGLNTLITRVCENKTQLIQTLIITDIILEADYLTELIFTLWCHAMCWNSLSPLSKHLSETSKRPSAEVRCASRRALCSIRAKSHSIPFLWDLALMEIPSLPHFLCSSLTFCLQSHWNWMIKYLCFKNMSSSGHVWKGHVRILSTVYFSAVSSLWPRR